jgi:hypothetical protein
MRIPTSRAGRLGAALASPLAVLAAAGMVWQASNAAFSGTTRNSGNNWSTGSVSLTDDDAGSARFQVTNMVPGQTDTKCITVTANASVPGEIRGYSVNPVYSAKHLEDHIFVTIEAGSGGSFASCDGFVAEETVVPHQALAAVMAVNSYANGLGGWHVQGGVSGGQHRTYRITWHFDPSGLNQSELDQLQNVQTGVDMQWELQSD